MSIGISIICLILVAILMALLGILSQLTRIATAAEKTPDAIQFAITEAANAAVYAWRSR